MFRYFLFVCLAHTIIIKCIPDVCNIINLAGIDVDMNTYGATVKGTADPGLIPGCITTGCDWESHRAAHNWPSGVRVSLGRPSL
jgi:hypothetical protein